MWRKRNNLRRLERKATGFVWVEKKLKKLKQVKSFFFPSSLDFCGLADWKLTLAKMYRLLLVLSLWYFGWTWSTSGRFSKNNFMLLTDVSTCFSTSLQDTKFFILAVMCIRKKSALHISHWKPKLGHP